ncbi:uncharacterized protein [Diadema setosum]|uniref:uncharacterized protein n=1 Tax=Diadema setosum TaxID=31175 RepID=UPI003B3AAF58
MVVVLRKIEFHDLCNVSSVLVGFGMRLTEHSLAYLPPGILVGLAVVCVVAGVPSGTQGLRNGSLSLTLVGFSAALCGLAFLIYYVVRILPLRKAIMRHDRPGHSLLLVVRRKCSQTSSRVRPACTLSRIPPQLLDKRNSRESPPKSLDREPSSEVERETDGDTSGSQGNPESDSGHLLVCQSGCVRYYSLTDTTTGLGQTVHQATEPQSASQSYTALPN